MFVLCKYRHQEPQYDEDDAGFRNYRSRSQNNGSHPRDDDDWLFKSSKDLENNLPEDYNEDHTQQRKANGFDPNGQLPREPQEPDSLHHNGKENFSDTPEGYWEARERYNQNRGRHPDVIRRGRDIENNPPAIYDYPPDEDIDGYSSPEEGKQDLRDRYNDDDPRSRSDSERDEQQREAAVSDKEMSDREAYGIDQVRQADLNDNYDNRKHFRPDENGERDHRERERYNSLDSRNTRNHPQRGDQRLDDAAKGDDMNNQYPSHTVNQDDDRQDGYNSLSESDQDRQIVAVEERLVSSSAPVEKAGYDERQRSSHQRQASRLAPPDDNRRRGQHNERGRARYAFQKLILTIK